MAHESLVREGAPQGSSDRSFGLVFGTLSLGIALYPLLSGGGPRLAALPAAAAFFAAALLHPRLLAPLNRAWTRFGLLLHRVVSPLVLAVVFFVVITPIALLARACGKRPLALRYDPQAPSYWSRRDPPGPASDSMTHLF